MPYRRASSPRGSGGAHARHKRWRPVGLHKYHVGRRARERRGGAAERAAGATHFDGQMDGGKTKLRQGRTRENEGHQGFRVAVNIHWHTPDCTRATPLLLPRAPSRPPRAACAATRSARRHGTPSPGVENEGPKPDGGPAPQTRVSPRKVPLAPHTQPPPCAASVSDERFIGPAACARAPSRRHHAQLRCARLPASLHGGVLVGAHPTPASRGCAVTGWVNSQRAAAGHPSVAEQALDLCVRLRQRGEGASECSATMR